MVYGRKMGPPGLSISLRVRVDPYIRTGDPLDSENTSV